MRRLSGKVAIITGAAGGVGEVVARLFVENGAQVVIADIDVAKGASLADRIGADAVFVSADISTMAGAQAIVDTAVDAFGGLDILVNNAGIFCSAPLLDHSEEQFDATIAVNLKGPWLCTKAALPELLKRPGASVINMGSIASIIGQPDQTAYGASKGGLAQLTRHCATELAAKGIRVNTISSGAVVTDMSFNALPGLTTDEAIARIACRNPLKRAGIPLDCAQAALWLASNEAASITGQNIILDSGVTTLRQSS